MLGTLDFTGSGHWVSYPASIVFSLAWLLAFTKLFVWLVCGVVDFVYTPLETGGVNKISDAHYGAVLNRPLPS